MKKQILIAFVLLFRLTSIAQVGPCTTIINTIAGDGSSTYCCDGGPATAAGMNPGNNIFIDKFGNIYLSDYVCRIRIVNTSGIINTIAGNGSVGFGGDGGPATAAELNEPISVACDTFGNIYITDRNNIRIRKVSPLGIISTFAGNGSSGYSGDGGPATGATFSNLTSVATDLAGNVYITDDNQVVRKVNLAGIISTIAGTGSSGDSGDGGPATAAQLFYPHGVAIDNLSNIYITDAGNNKIRKVNTSGIISTIAGTGSAGFSGDGGPATAALLNDPGVIEVDNSFNIYIPDGNNNRIREVNTSGIITTIAGTGVAGYSGNGGPATAAELDEPSAICLDGLGNAYIEDAHNYVRKFGILSPTVVASIAGSSIVCSGSSITITDSTTGGVWSSSNISIATVDTSGVVTGISGGATTISYTVTNACGSISATKAITVNPLPIVGGITGPIVAYMGSPITVTDATSDGVWSSTNTLIATVGSAGIVTPVAQGIDTIKYTVTNSSGCSATVAQILTVAGALPCYLPSDSLVAWFPFSGNTIDSSGNGNNGINYGATLTTDRFGYANSAYSFNGSSNYIQTIFTPLCSMIDSNISISLWCNSNNTSQPNANFFIADSIPSNSYASWYDDSHSRIVGDNSTSSASYDNVWAINPSLNGTWYHVVVIVTVPTSTIELYINGVLQASSSVSALSAIKIKNFIIGRSIWSSVWFMNGKIDDIGIWNRVLTPCEISQLYNASCVSNTITGTSTVCSGTTIALTDAFTGGAWTSSNTSIATVGSTGIVTGVSGGSSMITYMLGTGCATTKTIAVNPLPATIGGPISVCAGATISETDTTIGGVWSAASSNISIGSSTGTVTGVTGGMAIITYTAASGCNVTTPITVNPIPSESIERWTIMAPMPTARHGMGSAVVGDIIYVIGGANSTTILNTNEAYNTTTNSWATMAPMPTARGELGVAAVNGKIYAMGGYNGAAVNTVEEYDPVTNTWTTKSPMLTAKGLFSVGAIGDSIYAVGGWCCGTGGITDVEEYNTLTDTWTTKSSLPYGMTQLNNGAVLNGKLHIIGGGDGYGTIFSEHLVYDPVADLWSTSTSLPFPRQEGAATILNDNIYFFGGTTGNLSFIPNYANNNYFDSATSSWISRLPMLYSRVELTAAAVNGSIYVIGGDDSTDTSVNWNHQYSIIDTPAYISFSGSTTFCAGDSIVLRAVADTPCLYQWIKNGVNIPGATTVNYTAAAPGNYAFSIANSWGCGYLTVPIAVTVNPLPIAGTIAGTATVCAGSTTLLSDVTTDGIWSSAATGIATIGSTGVVTGTAAGTSTISYSVTNSCGTTVATKAMTVNPLPIAGTITGTSTVCAGSTALLSDAATVGLWASSAASIATIGATGSVTGVATGTSVISYSVTNSCGGAVATTIVTVNPLPIAGTISGSVSVCISSTIALAESVTGGVWSASNSSATIAADGIVTGAATGTDTISYSITNSCGSAMTTKSITVNSLPIAGTITGSVNVCVASAITLTESITGGAWSASNGDAMVTGGMVTGVAAGIDTIRYSATNSCGTATATKVITVNPLPEAGIITGPIAVCPGTTITLADAITGGTWSASNSLATVSGGVVTGISTGMDTIRYIISNSCGTATAMRTVTINALPYAGPITGPSSVCVASSITLTDLTTGGAWGSSNSSATVSGGVVTGMTADRDTISYSVPGICATAASIVIISILPLPSAGVLSGSPSVCMDSVVTLSDVVTGGMWSVSNASATVLSGRISGITAGTDTIRYVVTNSCGTDTTAKIIVVNPLPEAGIITGDTNVCTGAVILLTESVTTGAWSSSSSDATVSGGAVTGVTTGSATISYSVTNMCGTAVAMQHVVVSTSPSAGVITGASSVCLDSAITLVETITGGVWSSANTLTTVDSAGLVMGILPGAAAIIYSVTNTCGSEETVFPLEVLPGSDCAPTAVTNIINNETVLQVYPNPNKGTFTVNLAANANDDISIVITNVLGEVIKELTATTNEPTGIQLNEATGIYILSAITAHERYVIKVIVE